MRIDIQPTTREHVPALCALLNEIILIGGTTAYQKEHSEESFAAKFVNSETVISCLSAIDEEGMPIGFQYLSINQELPKNWGDIATFAKVGTTAKGIGKALFASTLKAAPTNGVVSINATIRADNVPGLAYYARIGFVDYNTIKDAPLNDGTTVDRICKRFDVGK